MIRVTADSNIYISALHFGGPPDKFLDLARSGIIELTISDDILAEVARVLRDKFGSLHPASSTTIYVHKMALTYYSLLYNELAMRTQDLKAERRRVGWGQVEAAGRLGVSQPYLAMLENGKRRLTPALAHKVVTAYGLPPTELPVPAAFTPAEKTGGQRLVEDLAKLDYPGFAYVRTRVRSKYPGRVLLTALEQDNLEGRVAEALPWLLLRYWRMDLTWLVGEAKKSDLQNRLGFVVNLARQLSERGGEAERTRALASLESLLESSRLAREDYFYRAPRNDRERQWLLENRPEAARHWNLLSDLRPEHLHYGTSQRG